MFHLFFVQSSHLEFLSASVIKERGLDQNKCCLILMRGYSAYSDFQYRSLPENWRGKHFRGLNGNKFYQNLCALRNFIEEITHDETYHIYLPQAFETFVPGILSDPNCKGFSHLEEGIHSLVYGVDENFRGRFIRDFEDAFWHFVSCYHIKKHFGNNTPIPRPTFTSSKADKYFYFSASCFNDIESTRRNRVNLLSGISFFSSLSKENLPKKCVIIVIDSLNFGTVEEQKLYLDLVLNCLATVSDLDERNIYLKPHPKTKNTEISETLISHINAKFTHLRKAPTELKFPLECMFQKEVDSIFIGGVSSTLLYAAECNKEVMSFADIIHTYKIFKRLHHSKSKVIERIFKSAGVKFVQWTHSLGDNYIEKNSHT